MIVFKQEQKKMPKIKPNKKSETKAKTTHKKQISNQTYIKIQLREQAKTKTKQPRRKIEGHIASGVLSLLNYAQNNNVRINHAWEI